MQYTYSHSFKHASLVRYTKTLKNHLSGKKITMHSGDKKIFRKCLFEPYFFGAPVDVDFDYLRMASGLDSTFAFSLPFPHY